MKLMWGSDFFCSIRENSSEHVRGIMPLSAPSGTKVTERRSGHGGSTYSPSYCIDDNSVKNTGELEEGDAHL